MSHIKIKNGKPITVPKARALKIKEAFDNPQIPYDAVFAFDDVSIVKSQIVQVMVTDEDDVSNQRMNEGERRFKELKQEQMKWFDQLLSLTPEDRAKEMDFFNMFFYSVIDRKPTDEEIKEAQELQLSFFKENNYPYPSPHIFKEMLLRIKGTISIIRDPLFELSKMVYAIGANYVPRSQYARQKQLEHYETHTA